jgi:hypothetical protein
MILSKYNTSKITKAARKFSWLFEDEYEAFDKGCMEINIRHNFSEIE